MWILKAFLIKKKVLRFDSGYVCMSGFCMFLFSHIDIVDFLAISMQFLFLYEFLQHLRSACHI